MASVLPCFHSPLSQLPRNTHLVSCFLVPPPVHSNRSTAALSAQCPICYFCEVKQCLDMAKLRKGRVWVVVSLLSIHTILPEDIGLLNTEMRAISKEVEGRKHFNIRRNTTWQKRLNPTHVEICQLKVWVQRIPNVSGYEDTCL